MKKNVMLSMLMSFLFALGAYGQVSVPEPEFSEQTLLLTSDTEGVLLARENGSLKTKAGASLYLTGIGKVKSRLTLAGVQSKSKVKGAGCTRLIIKAEDNKTDPNSFISVFKFEIKGGERRFLLAEDGTLSPTKSNNVAQIDYKAKKYGENSYYIVIEDLEPGEYGILLGDPNSENTKNSMKVTTFTVPQSE